MSRFEPYNKRTRRIRNAFIIIIIRTTDNYVLSARERRHVSRGVAVASQPRPNGQTRADRLTSLRSRALLLLALARCQTALPAVSLGRLADRATFPPTPYSICPACSSCLPVRLYGVARCGWGLRYAALVAVLNGIKETRWIDCGTAFIR